MNDTSKVLVATISGVALGIAAGLLVAPQSGKETRDQLGEQVKKAKKDIDGLIAKTKTATAEATKEAKAANNIKSAATK
jgi:gas vesicle protein